MIRIQQESDEPFITSDVAPNAVAIYTFPEGSAVVLVWGCFRLISLEPSGGRIMAEGDEVLNKARSHGCQRRFFPPSCGHRLGLLFRELSATLFAPLPTDSGEVFADAVSGDVPLYFSERRNPREFIGNNPSRSLADILRTQAMIEHPGCPLFPHGGITASACSDADHIK